MRSIFEVIDEGRDKIGASWKRIGDPKQKRSSRDLANVLSIPTTLFILSAGCALVLDMREHAHNRIVAARPTAEPSTYQIADTTPTVKGDPSYQPPQNSIPFSTSNGPRPAVRNQAAQLLSTTIPQRRNRNVVAADMALAIEASASQRHRPCGTWTLVSINPRLVALAVELHAVANRVPPAEHQQLLADAQQRLGQSGVRTFFARVEPNWGHCSAPGAAFIYLENQRGEQGLLVEATPSLRAAQFNYAEIGILMLADVVTDHDATFSVRFQLANGGEDASQTPVYFTFDATLGRALLSVNSTIPRSENPYALRLTVNPRALLPLDSNGDGFRVQDAIALFGNVVGAISTIVEIAGLAISAGELVATLAPFLMML